MTRPSSGAQAWRVSWRDKDGEHTWDFGARQAAEQFADGEREAGNVAFVYEVRIWGETA